MATEPIMFQQMMAVLGENSTAEPNEAVGSSSSVMSLRKSAPGGSVSFIPPKMPVPTFPTMSLPNTSSVVTSGAGGSFSESTLKQQENEIERLTKANFDLQLRLFHLDERLEAAKITSSRHTSTEESSRILDEKQKELEHKHDLLLKARGAIYKLNEALESTTKERDTLKQAHDQAEQKLATISAELAETAAAGATVSKAEQEQRMSAAIEEAEKRAFALCDNYAEELQAASDALAELRTIKDDLEAENGQLRSRIDELEGSLMEVREEAMQLQTALEETEEEFKQVCEDRDLLQMEQEKQKEILDRIKADKDELVGLQRQVQKEHETKLSEMYENYEAEKTLLMDELQLMRSQLDEKEDESGSYTSTIAEWKAKAEQLHEQLESIAKQETSQLDAMQAHNQQLQTQIDSLSDTIVELGHQQAKLMNERNALQGELDARNSEMQDLAKQVDGLTKKNTELSEGIAKGTEDAKKQDAISFELRKALEQEQLLRFFSEQNAIRYDELMKQHYVEQLNLTLQLSHAKLCKVELSDTLESKNAELQTMQAKFKQLEEEGEKQKAEWNLCKEELEARCSDLINELNSKKEDLEKSVAQLEKQTADLEQLQQQIGKLEAQSDEYRREYESKAGQLEKLQASLDVLESSKLEQLQFLDKEKHQHQTEVEGYRTIISERDARLLQLDADLQANQTELSLAQQKYNDAKQDWESSMNEIERLVRYEEELEFKLEQAYQTAQNDRLALEKQLKDIQEALESAEVSYKNLQDENETIRHQLEESQSRQAKQQSSRLEEEEEKLAQREKEIKAQFETEVAQWKLEKAALSSKTLSLEDKAAMLESANQALEAKLKETEPAYSRLKEQSMDLDALVVKLRSDLAQLEAEKATVEANLATSHVTRLAQDKSFMTLTNDFRSCVEELETVQKQVDALTAALEKANEMQKWMEAEINNNLDEKLLMAQELDQAKEELAVLEELRASYEEMQEELDRHITATKMLEEALTSSDEHNQELCCQIKDIEEARQKAEISVQEANVKLAELQKGEEAIAGFLNKELEQAKRANTELEVTLKEMMTKEDALLKSQSELAVQNQAFENLLQVLRSENASLTSNQVELSDAKHMADKTIASLTDQQAILQGEIDQLAIFAKSASEDKHRLEEQNVQLRAALTKTQSEMAGLQALMKDNDGFEQENSRLRELVTRAETIQASMEAAMRDKESLAAENAQLRQSRIQLDQAQIRIDQLTCDVQALTQSNSKLSEEHSKLQAIYAAVVNRSEVLHSENARLVSTLSQLDSIQTLADNAAIEKGLLLEENEQLHVKLQQLEALQRMRRENEQEEIVLLRAENLRMQSELAESRHTSQVLSTSVSSLQSMKSTLESVLAEKSALEISNSKMRKEQAKTMDMFEAVQMQLSDERAKMSKEREKMEMVVEDLKRVIAIKDEQLSLSPNANASGPYSSPSPCSSSLRDPSAADILRQEILAGKSSKWRSTVLLQLEQSERALYKAHQNVLEDKRKLAMPSSSLRAIYANRTRDKVKAHPVEMQNPTPAQITSATKPSLDTCVNAFPSQTEVNSKERKSVPSTPTTKKKSVSLVSRTNLNPDAAASPNARSSPKVMTVTAKPNDENQIPSVNFNVSTINSCNENANAAPAFVAVVKKMSMAGDAEEGLKTLGNRRSSALAPLHEVR